MTSTKSTVLVQPGIALATSIAAGAIANNHVEGTLVSTAITAGGDAIAINHAEGILVSTVQTAARWG